METDTVKARAQPVRILMVDFMLKINSDGRAVLKNPKAMVLDEGR